MRVIKHAFLSLIRKPTKAIMIFAILFVVFGLVFTGIIIQNSITKSKEFVRNELGAEVEFKPDYIKAMKDQLDSSEYEKLSLSTTLAKVIAKDLAVKETYITERTSGVNESLKSAVSQGDGFATATISSGPEASFPLIGTNTLIPLEFEQGYYTISDGRHRSEEDNGRDVLMISQELASKNNVAVGDTVEITSSVDDKAYSFEIIGIYTGSSSYTVDEMFTSLESEKKLAVSIGDEEHADSIRFMLHDPMDVEAFIERHKNQIPSDYIYLYSNDTEYKTLTRPLDLIATITNILLWVVFIAGAIIMIAIITIFVRDRKFEIGLLLASGESKIKIIAQFMLEILVVSVLAFTIAAGTSQLSSGYVAKWIVTNQLVEDDADARSDVFAVSLDQENEDAVKISDVAKEFDVSINKKVIIQLIFISFGLVLFSTSTPLMIILAYKPRETLQD